MTRRHLPAFFCDLQGDLVAIGTPVALKQRMTAVQLAARGRAQRCAAPNLLNPGPPRARSWTQEGVLP
jgi:hypothetical protein